ncbi:MAG TPA: alternative ribosome rescue aminoacyl-tRNA hydrolase ArfB [Actinomycetota bacterium]
MDHVRVNRRLQIPLDEITLTFSTAGGPGGQHANRSSTRVDLSWNVERSRELGPRQRQRLLTRLASRIDGQGNLRLSAGERRSQTRNREAVLERLAGVVDRALRVPKPRRKTAPSAAARERRLREKKQRSETKRLRRPPGL